MIYQFRCRAHGKFEVEQGMTEEHKASCPKCNAPAQRVYLPVIHYWPDVLWNKDGSRQSPDDLPHVPSGTKWKQGWSPREEQ